MSGNCNIISVFDHVVTVVWSPGWKNAQLAQQLEERERRIKNHLDLAAKGECYHDYISFT